MNTNATAQMVTSGGAGCLKEKTKMKITDQIATKLGHELWGQRNKLGVEQFIKRIISTAETHWTYCVSTWTTNLRTGCLTRARHRTAMNTAPLKPATPDAYQYRSCSGDTGETHEQEG